jgi:Uma2 family endonuclease
VHGMLESMLDPELLAPEKIRGLLRSEYDRLVDLGVFEDQRIELLRGQLVERGPQKRPHADAVWWLAHTLSRKLDIRHWEVRPQLPFAATDDSEPEPDIMITRRVRRGHHPTTASLLIEVAESSVRKDRTIKRDIYAEAGVPEYWVVDVASWTVEVYTGPSAKGYLESKRVKHGGTLRPKHVPGVVIRVRDIPGFAPKRHR